MKNLLIIVLLIFSVAAFSQEQKVDYKKIDNDLIKATYYFSDNNSVIEKEGFFNKKGKLQGTWISYDFLGNKTTVANYKNGIKEGVWMYYTEDKVSIVTYNNNKITKVEEKSLIVN